VAAWRGEESGGPPIPPPPPDQDGRERITLVQPDEKLHWIRGIVVGLGMILFFAVLAVLIVYVLSNTDWGRERVRRYAQTFINNSIHGRAQVGKVTGNLLTGMTVHNFVITDSAGEPFVAVESFRANYSILGLLRKRIWIEDAVLVRPLIVLDRKPVGSWNWQRIFPRDTTPKPPSQQTQWGDWLRFTNATVVNGQLIVRSPWHPSEQLKPVARDSAIRDALSGHSRLLISRAPGGFQKTIQLDSLTASIPLLRLSQPGLKDRLLEVESLTMNAYPFRPPGAVVRDLKGVFPFNNDSIWWKGAYAALPNSRASGDGSYVFESGDMTLNVHSDPASFADLRWVYPRLPSDGHGKLDLALKWRGALQDYQFSNTDIRLGEAHVTGALGVTLGDTLTIHNTNLRFAGLDTRTLEQLIPNFKSPRRGTFSGRASVSGGRHALALNGDVRFDDVTAGASRVVAVGGIGFLEGGGVRANNLRLQMLPVQVAMARTWYPSLPIGGVATGAVTVNGSTSSQLAVVGNVDLRDRGTLSALEGHANIHLTGRKILDVDVNAQPLSLVQVGRFFPSAGLQGTASGPIRLNGTLADLRVNADLRLPEGGRFATHGSLDLASTQKGYDLTSTLYTVNLRTVDSKAPITSLTAHAMVRGRGFDVATMRATIAADLSTSKWDSIAVDSLSVRANIGNGLAEIQRLYAIGAHTTAAASGSFGLVRGRSGTLTYRVAVDSLGAFNRWIPQSPGSKTPVAPRPQVTARAYQRARADSTRVARATEMERLISGKPGPKLVVAAPKPVPADTLAGSVHAQGTLSGNIYDFDLRGSAGGDNVIARGNFVRHFQAEYAWENARSPQSKLAVGLEAGDVSAMGFAFDTVSARLTYAKPGGHVELAVMQGDNREYSARGDYALYPDRKELRLADMTFRFDTTYWSMPHPSLVSWGGPGIRVTDFELRNRAEGRIYANGLLPTSGVADFRLDVDNFPVSNIVDIVQTDIDMTGILTLHGTMTGTLSAPAFRGAFGLVQGTYNNTQVPTVRGTFGYADKLLVTHFDAESPKGTMMMVGDGRIPINLALSGVTGSRLLPEPMAVDVTADSVPVELIPQFTDVVSNVHGRAAGRVSMRGTLKRPVLVGGFTLANGQMTIVSTGATISSIGAAVRMANDTVYVDSLAGWAKGPVHVRGTLAVGNWREPAFNLYLTSSGAELLNNDWGKVRIDAGLALSGPFNAAYLSGAATITQGVVYAPEPSGRHLIGAGDPALFNVLDTASALDRELFPPKSPLIANMRMEVALNVRHDTWVRNREANVEIYTDDPLFIREEDQAFALTGVVTTDRGEYKFLSKRFQIRRGSAMFIGSPDLNPTLQITGEYQVATASRGPLNIKVVIGGTLKKPALSLESDAQPPKTQSELLTLLAFGESTQSLMAFTTSSITGTAGTGDLFGAGAQMAVQRLASVALGVAVDNIEMQAGRAFGTDVLDITPGDVPIFAGGNGLANFFVQTRIEAGKYINPRTFVSGSEQAGRPGIAIEHRTQDGWHFNASIEPRILLNEPTLNKQPYRTVQSYGGFILREWRF